MLTIISTSSEDTQGVGRCLAPVLEPGDLLALEGELGAGKTVFAKGLAEGLRVSGRVTSPTFIVMRRHQSDTDSPMLFHVDAYRLSGPEELLDMGLDDWLGEGIVVIEWADVVAGALPPDHLQIKFRHAGDDRVLTVSAHGPRSRELLEHLRRCGY